MPALEAQETRNKAQAALAAIRAAQDAVGERAAIAEARRVRKAKRERQNAEEGGAEQAAKARRTGTAEPPDGGASSLVE